MDRRALSLLFALGSWSLVGCSSSSSPPTAPAAPSKSVPRVAPIGSAPPEPAVPAISSAPLPSEPAREGIVIEVRSERPAELTFDGDLAEWTLPESPGSSCVVVALTKSSWFVAFQVERDAGAGLRLDVQFRGGELPSIGEIMGGGGTYEVDCARMPGTGAARTAAARRRCEGIVRRYQALQRAEVARFVRRLRLDENGVWLEVDSTGTPVEVTPLGRACERESETLRCEVELPLGALPRSGEWQLQSVGLRVGIGAQVTAASEPLSDEDWYELPAPVAFEPGSELRRSVFGELEEIFPERDRYSFQPGGGLVFERNERGPGSDVVDVVKSTCDPEKAVARLGDVTLGAACGLGFVFHRKEFKGRYDASQKPRIFERSGALWVLAPRAWYDSVSARSGASWVVTRVDSSAQIETVELGPAEQPWERMKTTHDAGYRVLAIEGIALDADQRRVARRLEWRWDDREGAFTPSSR